MILGLIPSRLNSKRLKHKPLLKIDGLSIIVHTFKRAMLSKKLDRVIVCCDDKRILDEVIKHGGEAILTSKKHKNGTERIFEVAKKFKPKFVVDVQGDEPFVDPKDIDRVIDFHKKKTKFDIVVPSMMAEHNASSRNLVKVVFSNNGKILYFSRAAVPYDYKNIKNKFYRDLSIVSFKYEALKKYNKFKEGKIEKIEGIELLRAIENNLNLGTFKAINSGFAVDVNQDLMKAIDLMPSDKIRKLY
ncbi:3-deoxy-manno-octulosonate cytidylyltransferase [Pelagibacterales bacterium SAG-MED37]|nr:3-deoxy-manno-octulosonate cytidylyltransferase [Pelagibacterales bacterium SAG-MED37]